MLNKTIRSHRNSIKTFLAFLLLIFLLPACKAQESSTPTIENEITPTSTSEAISPQAEPDSFETQTNQVDDVSSTATMTSVEMIYENGVVSIEEHEKLGTVQVVTFTVTSKARDSETGEFLLDPETGAAVPDKNYHFRLITNFSAETDFSIEGFDAEAFMDYVQSVPGLEEGVLTVKDDDKGFGEVEIYLLDYEDDGIPNKLTEAFVENMQFGSGATSNGELDHQHYSRFSNRAPYAAMINLSQIRKAVEDYVDNQGIEDDEERQALYDEKFPETLRYYLSQHLAGALFTGEMKQREVVVEGKAIKKVQDLAGLEMNPRNEKNVFYVIINKVHFSNEIFELEPQD